MKRRAGESKKKKKKQLTELQQKRARQRGLTTKEWERQRREKLKKKEKKLSAADGGPKNRCKERFKLCLRRAGLAPTKKLALTGQAAELAQLLRFTNRSTFFLFYVTCELWQRSVVAKPDVFLNRELEHFQIAFDEIDLDGTKEIDYDELLELLGEARSPYTDALFSVVDDNQVHPPHVHSSAFSSPLFKALLCVCNSSRPEIWILFPFST